MYVTHCKALSGFPEEWRLYDLKKKKIFVWTSADGKWESKRNAQKRFDSFIFEISKIEGLKIDPVYHWTNQWKNRSVTDYFYTKLVLNKNLDLDELVPSLRKYNISISTKIPFIR